MKHATPDLKTIEEGGAIEATPTVAAGTTPAEGKKSHTAAFMAGTRDIG